MLKQQLLVSWIIAPFTRLSLVTIKSKQSKKNETQEELDQISERHSDISKLDTSMNAVIVGLARSVIEYFDDTLIPSVIYNAWHR